MWAADVDSVLPAIAVASALSSVVRTARTPLDLDCGMEPAAAAANISTITAKHEVSLRIADSTTNATNTCSRDCETGDAAEMGRSMMKNEELKAMMKNEELKIRMTTDAVVKKKPHKRTFATIADAYCKRKDKTIGLGGNSSK